MVGSWASFAVCQVGWRAGGLGQEASGSLRKNRDRNFAKGFPCDLHGSLPE